MTHSIRFCFVTVLVLLQLVAPLIHAHKNDENTVGTSFHLPEFEQIDVLLEKEPVMTSPLIHEGEVVIVSAGIKENQKRFSSSQNITNVVVLSFLFIVVFSLRTIKRFFVQTEPVKPFYFFNLSAPRAPPSTKITLKPN